jgi:hypothetical protein
LAIVRMVFKARSPRVKGRMGPDCPPNHIPIHGARTYDRRGNSFSAVAVFAVTRHG